MDTQVEIYCAMPSRQHLPRAEELVGAKHGDTGGWFHLHDCPDGNMFDAWFMLPSMEAALEAVAKLRACGFDAAVCKQHVD